MTRHPHRTLRGVSLVEAMVALAVMAFGMLAVVGVQSTLRLNADIAAQRSEATLLAQARMERERSFTLIEAPVGVPSWSTIATDGDPLLVDGLNARYEVRRTVTYNEQPAKVLQVTVSWNDRSGQPHSVVLNSSIAAAAPALSGTLAVRPGTSSAAPVRRPFQRHPSIPVQARDFGGTSAFVPPFRPWMVFVFNNVTGLVTGVCNFNYDTGLTNENITPSDVVSCNNTITGQLLSGFVRFQQESGGGDLTAGQVENPPGPALNMRITLSLTSSNHPFGSFCIDDANFESVANSLPFATYYCVIYSNSDGLWSGTTTVTPRNTFGNDWFISGDDSGTGSGADQRYRVCRYTPAASDSVPVSNQDHPRNYSNVSGNLTNQNFVVIRSVKHCPTDVPANPVTGDLVNSNTLQHQPAP